MIIFNCTIELTDEQDVSSFIHNIKNKGRVIDYSILPDTTKLYESDERFKQLVKEYKKVKTAKNIYIQENNDIS